MSSVSDSQTAHLEAKSAPVSANLLINGVLILVPVLFAALFHLGRLQDTYPIVILGGDGANIASWAAAWDYPQRFANDSVLSNPDHFSFYQTIHIPLIRYIARINDGNYGLAFISLLGPQIAVHLFGYYWLGRIVFKSRFWGVIFSIANIGYLALNLGEYWGSYMDPQPRFTFQALLPYLLTLAILWRSQPTRWPWLMIFAGLLIYVHPVSAPVWAFAIWLGLWLFHPPSWTLRKRVGIMLVMGILFLAIAVPFLANYSQNRTQPSERNYQELYSIIQAVQRREFWDTPYAVINFLKITTRLGLLPLAAASAVTIWWLGKGDRSTFKLILMWLTGIGLISVVIPYVEQNIERALEILPVQLDLVRGLRYTVPLMLMFIVWALALISQRTHYRHITRLAGVALAGMWIYLHPPYPNTIAPAFSCLQSGHLVCTSNRSLTLDLYNAVLRLTPPDATIMPSFGDNISLLVLRYGALRPLVFTQKDRALFGYNIPEQEMREWDALYERARTIQGMPDDEAQLQALVDFSRERGAQYLIILNDEIDPATFSSQNLEIVYANAAYSLIRL